MLATDLPLAVIERKEAKQIAQKKKEDWNEIEVRSISEILVAAEVTILDYLYVLLFYIY